MFLVELQEPTDFSVLLEWDGYDVDGAADGHLGLGYDLALQCVDRSGWAAEKLETLRRRAREEGDPQDGVRPLLVPAAEQFFRADGLRVPGPLTLDAAFAILVVLSGGGRLRTEHGGELELARGHTVLVPHAAGRCELSGRLEAVRCRPPLQPPRRWRCRDLTPFRTPSRTSWPGVRRSRAALLRRLGRTPSTTRRLAQANPPGLRHRAAASAPIRCPERRRAAASTI